MLGKVSSRKKIMQVVMAVLITISCVIPSFIMSNKPQSVFSQQQYNIYALDSTVKICKYDNSYSKNGKKSVDFIVAKNEYEGKQIVINSDKRVKSYYCEVSDLSNGEIVISKSNFITYIEKYTYISNDEKYGYAVDYYPDALIPIDTAKEHGELVIDENSNAVIYLSVYIPKETPSGIYSGNVTLTVDEEKEVLPLKVTVIDYILTDENNAKNTFSARYFENAYAEFDSTVEANEKLYEFAADYRVSLQCQPLETLSGEEAVYYADKYFDVVSTYSIMNVLQDIRGEFNVHVEHTRELVLALAAGSSPERNLLSKAILYLIDEPNFDYPQVVINCINLITQLNGMLENCVTVIEADNTGLYDNFKKMTDWKNYILDIPNIVPVNQPEYFKLDRYTGDNVSDIDKKRARLLSLINTICPQWNFFDDEYRQNFFDTANYFNCNIWWYGCGVPAAPYATYHIADKNLLSSRSISWLQKMYNVEGNLYWDFAGYFDGSTYRGIDVYENPYILPNYPAGDGIISYPGMAYGLNNSLPSLRLMSIRDGMEEYEMLLDAEKYINELSVYYGETFDANTVLKRLYDRLYYSGSSMYSDYQSGLVFSDIRESLLNMIDNERQKTGFVINNYSLSNAEIKVDYLVKDGYSVFINDKKQQASEKNHYTYTQPQDEGSYVKFCIVEDSTGKKFYFNEFIVSQAKTLNSFNYDKQEDIKGITLSKNSSLEINRNSEFAIENNSLKFTVASVVTGKPSTDSRFRPEIKFDISSFENAVNFSDVLSLSVDIYNAGEKANITMRIYSGTSYQDCSTISLDSGWNKVTIPVSTVNFSKMSSADTISFIFNNGGTIEKPIIYEIYMDNMLVIEK